MQKKIRLASTAINLPKDEDVQQEEEKRQEGEKSKIERIEAWLMARYDFRRNTVLQKIEVKEKVQGAEWHVMEDAEENDLLYELNKANFTKPEGMMNVILGSSRIETYNPIDEYFSHNELRTMGNIRRLMNCVELNPTIDQLYDGRTYRQIFEEYFVKYETPELPLERKAILSIPGLVVIGILFFAPFMLMKSDGVFLGGFLSMMFVTLIYPWILKRYVIRDCAVSE